MASGIPQTDHMQPVDPCDYLPDEILVEIVSFLDKSSLCSVAMVSKKWKIGRISHWDRFWISHFETLLDRPVTVDGRSELKWRGHFAYMESRCTLALSFKEKIVELYRDAVRAGQRKRKARIDRIQAQLQQDDRTMVGKREILLDNFQDGTTLYCFEDQRDSFRISAKHFKLVVVGDKRVGKTSLIIRAATGKLPRVVPFVPLNNYSVMLEKGDSRVILALRDITGCSRFSEQDRRQSYRKSGVILVMFDVANPSSFESVVTKWIPELNARCPNVPRILVGTKSDLQEDRATKQHLSGIHESFISVEEGQLLARRTRCAAYIAISSLTGINIKRVLAAAAAAALESQESQRCLIQ